jgi:hypothetical protein
MSQPSKHKLFVFMRFGYGPGTDYMRQEWYPQFFDCKPDNTASLIFLEEREVAIDLSNFNPVPAQLEALEVEKQEATRQFVETTAKINERISKLLAIEHTPTEVVDAPAPDDRPF